MTEHDILSDAEREALSEVMKAPIRARAAQRVLIVEDDLHIAELLRMHLRDEGYVVEHAADGDTGLRELERSHWDALVLDLMLPGIDGLEALRRFRSMPALARVPFVMLTGKSEEQVVVESLKLGASDFIAKPFDRATLLAKIVRFAPLQGGQTS